MYRTHKLNELRINNVGEKVILSGWVSKIRNLGSFAFIDLRDRYGITQILVKNETLLENVKNIKSEYVIKVVGTVSERSSKNSELETGDIEVIAENIEIISSSKSLPFEIKDNLDINETMRFKYRYLDLRRNKVKENIKLRSKMLYSIRQFLNDNDFLDVDTPILGKSTPEGARDFLVPSRINLGDFYALPQSPQLFKQTLMIAGIDRYYQVAKCFRDEDLRKDRQPEFTQIDLELSYVEQDDVLDLIERLAKNVTKEITGIEFTEKFPRITYDYAMNTYGSDKPDTRFDLKIQNVTDVLKNTEFQVFLNAQTIRCLVVDNFEYFTRKILKDLEDFIKNYYGAKGLAYIKFNENKEMTSSISKFITSENIEELEKQLGDLKNKTILIVADEIDTTLQSLGALRLKLGEDLNLIDNDKYNYLWVVDFPMFEYSKEENRFKAQHHPFTSIKEEDIEKLKLNELAEIRTNAYDLVLNGFEVGGGSIRIHNSDIQEIVFEKLGLSNEEQEEKFGFFLEALKYGVPPHGGFAFGFDRWLMVLINENSIKEVIPFPKTNKGQDLMMQAPSSVDESQLNELKIKLEKE